MSAIRKYSVTSPVRDLSVQASRLILEGLNTPLSRSLVGFLDSGDFLPVVSSSVNPSAYSSAASFSLDYLACEVLSKFPDFPLEIKRDQVALGKFLASESTCGFINRKLSGPDFWRKLTPETQAVIFTARAKIRDTLGPINWNEVEQGFNFGPGATFARRRTEGDAYHKFRLKPSVTRSCSILADCAVRRVPRWFEHLCLVNGTTTDAMSAVSQSERIGTLFDIVPGNRVVTVPKNAKTDRTIAIEPCMNMYIQKGLGWVMRQRLRRRGVTLNDQTPNQRLAREGSLNGTLATIDLSAASDSISNSVVDLMLPPDWVDAINLTRSPRGVLPSGELVSYQKVASMGNGFTFELESLIFWGLASACMSYSLESGSPLAVYGDDIIVPTLSSGLLIRVLDELGFTTNKKKTFVDGPFRESCGKHYFNGEDVTPFYIDHKLNTHSRYIWLANSIKVWCSRPQRITGLRDELFAPHSYIVNQLPPWVRRLSACPPFIDLALYRDFDEVCPRFDNSHFGFAFKGFVALTKSKCYDDVPWLLRSLNATRNREESVFEQVLRKRVKMKPVGMADSSTYRLGTVYTQQWHDLGYWVNPGI